MLRLDIGNFFQPYGLHRSPSWAAGLTNASTPAMQGQLDLVTTLGLLLGIHMI